MPPVSDTQITDWAADYATADTNTPRDRQDIGGLLDDEMRNFRSVVRAEAENKEWERYGRAPTFLNTTAFSFEGDMRLVARPGRRVKAILDGAVKYGHVKSATLNAGITVVQCIWDLDEVESTHGGGALTATGPAQATCPGDFTEVYAENAVVQMYYTGTGAPDAPYTGVVANSAFNGTHTLVNFSDTSGFALNTAAPSVVFVRSGGIDETLSEVQFGAYTPDLLQSGWPHTLLAGQVNVPLDGVNTSFAVPLGVRAVNANTEVMLQPIAVVTGTPTNSDWTLARVTAFNSTSFTITLPTPVGNATVRYDYVIFWGQG